jgi:hypothetical protein
MRRPFYVWPHRREDTCRVHVKKYYDCDQQKYIRDKLEKLTTYSLAEIAETDHFTSDNYWRYPTDNSDSVFNFPKFIPKDDDWVDEPVKKIIPVVQEVPKKIIAVDQIKITRPTDGVSVQWLKSMLKK